MKSLTKEWVEKAESDRILAEKANDGDARLYGQICFHCQQSAEKYLKAILEELNQIVPKTHNLLQLLMLLTPFYPELRKLKRGLIVCSKYAVDSRYPGLRPTKRHPSEFQSGYREECATANIDYVPTDTRISYDKALMEYLVQRTRRF